MEDALTLAATVQCLTRHLVRLRHSNLRWRIYDRFLVNENRWRAQRYGVNEGLIDFGIRQIVPVADLTAELVEILEEDAEALNCRAELERLADIPGRGTSSDRQRAVQAAALGAGATEEEAMRAVVRHLIEEFHADL
jgi:carboxylate-amine ligase